MTGKPILILPIFLIAFCLGEPECSPENQCADLWSAKKCDVVKNCIAEDWSKLRPTGERDDVCSICLEMVKEARDTLRSNETREQLQEVLEGSCRLLVLKPAVDICDKLVDEFIPELVNVLSSQMDPETVCAVARLCNNEALRIAQRNSKDCVHCNAFAQVAELTMESLSASEFKNGILRVCRSAGGFSDACSHFGLENSDFLYQTTRSILKKKPCEATLLCPSGSKSALTHESMETTKRKMCPLCKDVMASLRKQLLRVKSVEGFAENVLATCEELEFSNSTCSQMSSRRFYEKLQDSEGLLDAFCAVTHCLEKPKKGEEEYPVWPLLPVSGERFQSSSVDLLGFLGFMDAVLPKTDQEETEPVVRPTIAYGDPIENPIFLSPVLPPNVSGGDQEECDTCNEVLGVLSEPVKNDDDYLNKMFDLVCDGVKNQEKCKRFIDKFSPYLTKAFAEDGVSKEMCADLVPYCQVKRTGASSERCNACLNAMKIFKHGDLAGWGLTLENKCNSLLGISSKVCKDLSWTLQNLSDVSQRSNESVACDRLKFCEPSSAKLENEQALTKPSCESCLLAVQSITDALKSNRSDELIETLLDSLCDMLPHAEKRLCYNVVKTVGVDGFKKLLDNISPTEVCRELHICRRKDDSETAVVPPETLEKTGKVPCKFCLMAVKMLLDQLEDDKTEEAIRKAIDGLCKYFPAEVNETCQNLVDEYAEYLIDMIIADFNETEICTYLKICPAHVLLLAAKEKNFVTYDVETNEVRDWVPDQLAPIRYGHSGESAEVTRRHEEVFDEFHKVVQECALCEALVGVISRHKAMLDKNYDFPGNAQKICHIVPKNKLQMCKSMLISYGPSIVNLLLDHKIDVDEVCVYLDLCDSKMQAKVNEPVSVAEPKVVTEGKNDCVLGPAFWCANAENAEKCGTFLHCQETVWKSWKSPPQRRGPNF